MNLLTHLLLFFSLFVFIKKRLYRYLHYFQQEEYNSKRFFSWLWEKRAFDRKGFLILGITLITSYIVNFVLINLLASIAFIWISYSEEDPRKMGKIKLKMTERASRIYNVALVSVSTVLFLFFLVLEERAILALAALLIMLIPLFLIFACQLLQPNENRRQKQFVDEAKIKLASVSPFVIAITGSYGKTSSKDALSHLLQVTLAPTFWPSKGINTPMGITREIRASLSPEHRYAVIEMGAYGIGSIKRLCDLTPPHAALITTIGSAHLERFRSLENIRKAKSELAQAVPKEGILICNGDDAGARSIAQEYRKKTTLFYGFNPNLGHLDCWVSRWNTHVKGTDFTLHYLGNAYTGFVPLFGQPALSNALGAFLMACTLGSSPAFALAAMRNLEPVSNRMQVKQEGDITYIHDAYNSNPQGFSAALQVLKDLPGKRKVLMTPGMIELGTEQKREHQRLGQQAGSFCDLVLLVGETNRTSLTEGLLAGGMKLEQIFCYPTRDQALMELANIRRSGDLILIENDLPDLYEAKARF